MPLLILSRAIYSSAWRCLSSVGLPARLRDSCHSYPLPAVVLTCRWGNWTAVSCGRQTKQTGKSWCVLVLKTHRSLLFKISNILKTMNILKTAVCVRLFNGASCHPHSPRAADETNCRSNHRSLAACWSWGGGWSNVSPYLSLMMSSWCTEMVFSAALFFQHQVMPHHWHCHVFCLWPEAFFFFFNLLHLLCGRYRNQSTGDWFCFVFNGDGGGVGSHQSKRGDLCNQ